jgi:hypothetical protein
VNAKRVTAVFTIEKRGNKFSGSTVNNVLPFRIQFNPDSIVSDLRVDLAGQTVITKPRRRGRAFQAATATLRKKETKLRENKGLGMCFNQKGKGTQGFMFSLKSEKKGVLFLSRDNKSRGIAC